MGGDFAGITGGEMIESAMGEVYPAPGKRSVC